MYFIYPIHYDLLMSLPEQERLELTVKSIQKDFELDSSELESVDGWEELQKRVERIVSYMVDHNMGDFLNMLYIMDVSESKIRRALAETAPAETIKEISRIIIERELEKVESRANYRERGFTDEDERWED